MRFKLLVIGAAIAVVATTVGISGFTSATVERQADINVTDDTEGLLALEPGNESQIVKQGGQLQISMSETTAKGLNENATFTFGNPANPNSSVETYAFKIINKDDESHEVGLDFSLDSDPAGSTENINFSVYDDTNVKQFSETDENPGGEIVLTSKEEAFVVLKFTTTNVNKADDLDGTLNVTA
jgi:hypothetical protein